MKGKDLLITILVGIVIALLFLKMSSSATELTPPDKGNVIVFGSKACPWCVKQEKYLTEKGIPYTFVDCTTNQCPAFVESYPTLQIDGEIRSGYSEI